MIIANVIDGYIRMRKVLSLTLLIAALFSGQLLARHHGHIYFPVTGADHQLRHEADSDELRATAEESAESLRDHHHWQKSRRPDTHFT